MENMIIARVIARDTPITVSTVLADLLLKFFKGYMFWLRFENIFIKGYPTIPIIPYHPNRVVLWGYFLNGMEGILMLL
jgi:hypothetical protein